MTVTLNSGDRKVPGGTYQSKEDLTQSTATARQSISVHHAITTLSGGTATGFDKDLYTLASTAVEGMEKTICMLATGEAKVVIGGLATIAVGGFFGTSSDDAHVSATGAFTLSVPGHYILCKKFNERWWVTSANCTFATAT